ncbi:germ cell nuclear acidic protein isoform X2 [Drosophila sulfurigaster albostrigata]|nr:germ cell nuclear acidic protein isoform X2 [Drosophila sulfurigaster albostrigata]XP_062137072.1 germ cell nuclear acidic protein isoform X2 [Drosophila sulfurigaster albostrigata]XP_062137073.1 germ cell nuclear acidic protein isoform X2 [Drosophila sulfurigaster albostrigata]
MRNMEEDDPTGMFEAGEEKSIVMRVPKPMPPPKGRVLPTSIELRLLEMQRKLSAIAEIPKILSSTLATVSQSFDSLEAEASYKRKCSYDEDALDYELHEQPESECDSELDESDDAEDDEEDDLVQVQDDNDAEDAVHKLKSESLKDATPESDYASEANYATNETSDEPDNGNDYEDDEVRYDEEAVFYLKLPAGADIDADADTDNTTRHTEIAARATAQLRADAVKNISSECDSSDLDEDEDEVAKDNNDSDFLSTTYTWNLRNVPKLRINDAEGVCNLTLLSPQLEQHNTIDDTSKVRAATPTPTPTPTPASMSTSTTSTEEAAHSQSQKLLFKLDNLERSWPWADREKIIYKQSTCHLVPRKPLGIVGQRIQLLAKQELQRKDKAQ